LKKMGKIRLLLTCDDFKEKYPTFNKHILERKNNYFMFLN